MQKYARVLDINLLLNIFISCKDFKGKSGLILFFSKRLNMHC